MSAGLAGKLTGLVAALLMAVGVGYGAGYRYDPDTNSGVAGQQYLPEELRGARFYEPGPYGFERDVRKRLEWWAQKRREAASGDDAEAEETAL